MFSKKNRLITIIIISMIIGIALGYGINKSITNNAPKIEQSIICREKTTAAFND